MLLLVAIRYCYFETTKAVCFICYFVLSLGIFHERCTNKTLCLKVSGNNCSLCVYAPNLIQLASFASICVKILGITLFSSLMSTFLNYEAWNVLYDFAIKTRCIQKVSNSHLCIPLLWVAIFITLCFILCHHFFFKI